MVGRNANYYDAHAHNIDLEQITSDHHNAIILQKLRDNDPELTDLSIDQNVDDDPSIEFAVREGDDLGWLGYFLGGCTTLTELYIRYLSQEKWRTLAFIRELVSNRSIQRLAISTDLGEGFHSLGTLLKSDTFVALEFNPYGHNFLTIDLQCARNIAIMLGEQNQCNHLTSLVFEDIEISGEAMAEIAPVLSAHPQLEKLDLSLSTGVGRLGNMALGRMLEGWKNPKLKELILWYEDDFDDEEGLLALVAGMRNCRNLTSLRLEWDSITTNGCRLLSTLFQSDNFCLKKLNLNYTNIDGHCAAALATALENLFSLKSLSLSRSSIDIDGLRALAPAIASLRLLETLNCSSIGNEGVRAIVGVLANLNSLEELTLSYNSIGNEGATALAAGLMDLRSLKKLDLSHTSIGDEGATALADGLRHLRSLKSLILPNNSIGDDGISALAPALASIQSFEELYLSNNSIGDEGLQALVEGISHCSKLSKLRLDGNRSITALGVVSLSALLRSDNCSLAVLELYFIRIGNDGAAALADGLRGKTLLRELHFSSNQAGITEVGWSAFSKLLCDTSSVNNTYLSNHTLQVTCDWEDEGAPDDVKQLLELNKHPDEHVAIHKILKSHADFDVEPFFEWNLKALPLVVSWFERVITLMNVNDHKWISDESLEAIQSRKLSTMYKFIRGLPHMTTDDGYRSRKNPTKFAFLRRKISLSHLLNGMALRLRVKHAHANRNA
jgi:Ran GTPase-activating protein (RanGAP) involved in mRNA processing and transport